jgi:DNA-binding LytR/AlgR family response regulator
VNDTPVHSTLRELRGLARAPRTWVVLAVLSAVVGLVGPFGTFELMPPVPRLAYWAAIVVGTATIGTLVASFAEAILARYLPPLVAAAVAGALAGPPIAALVYLLNLAVFGAAAAGFDFLALSIYCAAISAAVTVLGAYLGRQSAPAAPVAATEAIEAAPALLQRLPQARQGRLLHLAVADHYVEVTTDRGTTLVLIRLSDAIREAAPVPGLQVHRSHWVALDAVRRGLRQAGKPLLELENGTLVPVSRSCLPAVRATGWL